MRKIVHSTALSALIITLMVSIAWAAPNRYRVHVKGLACPFCAYGIEKSMSRVKGVGKVDTNIAKGTVTVTMREGATLDRATAAKAVKDAGFDLGGFEQVRASARK